MLDFHECCYFAPRVYAAHSGLASSSPRPKASWLVTGNEVSKQSIFFTVLGAGWRVHGGIPCSLSSVLP